MSIDFPTQGLQGLAGAQQYFAPAPSPQREPSFLEELGQGLQAFAAARDRNIQREMQAKQLEMAQAREAQQTKIRELMGQAVRENPQLLTTPEGLMQLGQSIAAIDPEQGLKFLQLGDDKRQQAFDNYIKEGNLGIDQAKLGLDVQKFKFDVGRPETEVGKLAADLDKLVAAKGPNDPAVKALTQQIADKGISEVEKSAKATQSALEEKVFNKEAKLRNDYTQQAGDFFKIQDSFQRIKASVNDPSAAGDLALIFNYMKMLDPDSVVRESEFATAENAGSIPERIRAQFNKVRRGERLSEAQRADFFNRSQKLFDSQMTVQSKLEERYGQMAKQYDLTPENVLTRRAGDTPKVGEVKTDMPDEQLNKFADEARAAGVPEEKIRIRLEELRRSRGGL